MNLFLEYGLVPLLILLATGLLGWAAIKASRRSRRLTEQYSSATAEEQAQLDRKMDRDPRLAFMMRRFSWPYIVVAAIGVFLTARLLSWLAA
jgi:hypothetical protein